jgi:hypothetical protein
MVSKNAIKRILKDTPNAKFIIIARDPVDRIVSHYNWLSSLSLINKKPGEEIEFHINEKFNYRNSFSGNFKAYLDFSLYGKHMQDLLQKVNQQNVFFLTFEDFFSDFDKHRNILGDFLDLDLSNISLQKVNETSFDKKNIKKKTSLKKRIISKLKFEFNILKGAPRGLSIDKPVKYRTSRNEIETLLLPFVENDIRLLENLGYNLESWPTYHKLN